MVYSGAHVMQSRQCQIEMRIVYRIIRIIIAGDFFFIMLDVFKVFWDDLGAQVGTI